MICKIQKLTLEHYMEKWRTSKTHLFARHYGALAHWGCLRHCVLQIDTYLLTLTDRQPNSTARQLIVSLKYKLTPTSTNGHVTSDDV